MIDESQIKVLVTDDEAPIRESLGMFLEDYGFDVSLAQSAEEALEVLDAQAHDVAIIDLRLPGMSGDALIQEAHQRFPGLRFIIYTGSVSFSLPKNFDKIDIRTEHVFFKPQPDLGKLAETIKQLADETES